MASAARGRKREELTYVAASASVMYGFKTFDISAVAGITAGDLTALGHVKAAGMTNDAAKVYVLRANAPKPPRVSKKTTAGTAGTTSGGAGTSPLTVSTFCAFNKLNDAFAAKWTLAKRGRGVTFRGENSPTRQRTVAIPIGGGFYCFSCDRSTFTTYGAALGLKGTLTEAEAAKAFMGASAPKPGNAGTKTANGSVSSFYDPTKKGDLIGSELGWSLSEAILLM
ncbi:MAG: hypothetical protein ACRC78_12670 [Planktothrix sp.]